MELIHFCPFWHSLWQYFGSIPRPVSLALRSERPKRSLSTRCRTTDRASLMEKKILNVRTANSDLKFLFLGTMRILFFFR